MKAQSKGTSAEHSPSTESRGYPRPDTRDDTPRLWSVCPTCGDTFDRPDDVAQCTRCKPQRNARPVAVYTKSRPEARGYDRTWRKLSRRARKAQPFCTDCRTPEDLTADHSPEAWARYDSGKVIRLEDIDVVCRRCNADRGAARGETIDQHPGAPRLPDLPRGE